MASGDLFIALMRYLKNRISENELISSDKYIVDVNENNSDRGLSEIVFKFSGSNVLKLLDVSGDDIYFYNIINSPYESWYFLEYRESKFDLTSEGYGFWPYLNFENVELLEKISHKIYSKKFEKDFEIFRSRFASFLFNMFPKEMDSINETYVHKRNIEMNNVARKSINEEIASIESFFKIKDDETLVVNAKKLFSYFIEYHAQTLNAKELIKKIAQENEFALGGWIDNAFEYTDSDYFDDESFNNEASRQLNNILEKIDDSADENTKNFFEVIQKIINTFEVNEPYYLPKNKNYSFKILDFDIENQKIILALIKPTSPTKQKKLKLSEENFYNLLYQPELFDFDEIYNF